MQESSTIFLGSEIKQGNKQSAKFHVIPVPFEKSVSYGGGTARGPAAIIAASNQLETYDQLGAEPCELGIYTHDAIDCRGETADVMQRIRAETKIVAQNGNIPFVLGGEHTISYGAAMGIVDAHAGERIGIIQFDAHADLRESYEGSVWSHACVMKRLIDEGLPLFQLAVRAISMEEKALRAQYPAQIHYLDARDICGEEKRYRIDLPYDFPEKIYISVDVDGLDGAIMPATGTPVPGGLHFWQLISLLKSVVSGREIVGMDLVEFSPIQGFHIYDYTVADLAYKMMGIAIK